MTAKHGDKKHQCGNHTRGGSTRFGVVVCLEALLPHASLVSLFFLVIVLKVEQSAAEKHTTAEQKQRRSRREKRGTRINGISHGRASVNTSMLVFFVCRKVVAQSGLHTNKMST